MFDGPIFWMIMGALFVLVAVGIPLWMIDKGIVMNKVKWTLLIIWYLFLLLTVSAPLTAFAENEAVAGYRMALVFGVVAIISGVGLWRYLLASKSK